MSNTAAPAELPRPPALDGEVRRLPTWRYVLHLIRFQPWLYAALAVLDVIRDEDLV